MRTGTYARESGGGCLLYHSDTRWNDASEGLRLYLNSESTSSLYKWRLVTGEEADAVWHYCKLGPGENIEITEDEES